MSALRSTPAAGYTDARLRVPESCWEAARDGVGGRTPDLLNAIATFRAAMNSNRGRESRRVSHAHALLILLLAACLSPMAVPAQKLTQNQSAVIPASLDA